MFKILYIYKYIYIHYMYIHMTINLMWRKYKNGTILQLIYLKCNV